MKRNLLLVLLVLFTAATLYAKQIRLLTIGNSFSEDAVEQYLYELAAASGDVIIIGNLYIGGSTLGQHYNNSVTNAAIYEYRKVVNGVRTVTGSSTLRKGILDEDWDYISFQQASHDSGLYNTYFPSLTHLLNYVKGLATNPHMECILHRTWAYAQNSTHAGFANYGNNQITMFNAIVNTYNQVAQATNIDMIIPAGTAIQNGRTSILGDTFCRDGFHLELTYGRFTAACTWYEKLFEKPVINNTYKPATITPFQALIAKNAAHYAVTTPNAVTSLIDLDDGTPTVDFTKTINISFGGSSAPGWNLLSDYNLNANIAKLQDVDGNYTNVSIKVTDRFGGINPDGPATTNTSMNIPTSVSKDSFFGNTGDWGGFEPTAAVKFSGLPTTNVYSFKIFAGRMNVTDNRETYFRFDGIRQSDTIVYLNASNNSSNIAQVYHMRPSPQGEIEIRMKPGPNNNNGYGFYYISALSIESSPITSIEQHAVETCIAYPNPFVDQIHVLADDNTQKISIYNIYGEEVYSLNRLLGNSYHTIYVGDLLPGTYIVKNGTKYVKLLKHAN